MEEKTPLTEKEIAVGTGYKNNEDGNNYYIASFCPIYNEENPEEWIDGVLYYKVATTDILCMKKSTFAEKFSNIEKWEMAEDMNPNLSSVKNGMSVFSKRMGVGSIYSIAPAGSDLYPIKAKFKFDGGEFGKPTVKTVSYNSLGQTNDFGKPTEFDATFQRKKHA